ncbi:nuclear transport factor 2 family protein [Streptomyces griseorubiginosus]|uniref:nuclear transport factor 2 family protein n=1 Tax=Streptomyces griseorubiginosus TaxID=67304 RepID=UPI00362EFC4F
MTDESVPTTELHETLSAWWDTVAGLTLDSPQTDWDAMTAYLADDCVLYFGGMGAPASEGLDAVVSDLKTTLTYWRMAERRVLSHGLDAEGTTVFASMNNRLEILGEPIDYPETEVVTFDEAGKIARYELYCDPSPIRAVFAKKNPVPATTSN